MLLPFFLLFFLVLGSVPPFPPFHGIPGSGRMPCGIHRNARRSLVTVRTRARLGWQLGRTWFLGWLIKGSARHPKEPERQKKLDFWHIWTTVHIFFLTRFFSAQRTAFGRNSQPSLATAWLTLNETALFKVAWGPWPFILPGPRCLFYVPEVFTYWEKVPGL